MAGLWRLKITKNMQKIIGILLFYCQICIGQVPSKIWDKTLGGSANDGSLFSFSTPNYTSIAETLDSGFVIAGNSESGISGNKTEASRGQTDYWIVKINKIGQIVWNKTIGGSLNDYATSIVSTADGGFIVAGYSFSNISGEKTENNRGNNTFNTDIWIVKLNNLGQKVWDKTYGGSSSDNAFDLTKSNDGNYVVVGSSSSNISGEKTENSKGNDDYWVIKFNDFGNIIWEKTYGGAGQDIAYGIVQALDNSFVIIGESKSNINGDKSEPSFGGIDYWMVKLDSGGGLIWDKTFGGNNDDVPNALTITTDGGFVATGYSFSDISGNKTENSHNNLNTDYWIVKVNSSGQKLWDRNIGGLNYDEGTSILATPDNGIITVGNSTSSNTFDKSEVRVGASGIKDFWLVKLNNLGQKVWDKTFGSTLIDVACRVIPTSDENYIIAGFSSGGISGNKSEISNGGSDFWALKFGFDVFETITTGNWNIGSTWIAPTNTLLPTATKTTKINTSHTVTIPNTGNQVKTIQMNGGNINLTGGTIQINN
jgi:hypothetical protein